ncbi:MAG TPA: threonine synthase [Bacteroidota bacterium]|nr:threonine synthase [Bacteroidota bacterium]
MKYKSTAGQSPSADFSTALFQGLSPDGGLYVPESIPHLQQDFIDHIEERSLHEIAVEILSPYIPEFSRSELSEIVESALNFPIPLVPLEGNINLLELFHGPTLAFKDVGARCMARFLSRVIEGHNKEITILVATSGDTGSAVAHGFYKTPHISVFVLYPSGKISRLQEHQMATLGDNIHAIEIEGTFDDCQRIVRKALTDPEVRAKREVTTANSMNIGRLLPQIAYYAWAYAQWKGSNNRNEKLAFIVPTGNLGNLTAAVYARHMGIPVSFFVAAMNANDMFKKYLQSGEVTPVPSIQTISNAMDVGNPSNLARLTALYQNDVKKIRKDIRAESFSDQETLQQIRSTHERTGYILDPHTAVGVAAAARQSSDGIGDTDYVVAATAHPAKFQDVIQDVQIQVPKPLQEALSKKKLSIKCRNDYEDFRRLLFSGTSYTA